MVSSISRVRVSAADGACCSQFWRYRLTYRDRFLNAWGHGKKLPLFASALGVAHLDAANGQGLGGAGCNRIALLRARRRDLLELEVVGKSDQDQRMREILPHHWFRYVPRDRVPAWVAVGWTAISAPFRWSTWTGQPLGEVVIMEWERSGQPKEPVD
jgi:hypothetical protein